ncbi:hypothetical protein IAQ61_010532, partial [Plenodomus lingam]|uniref:uncharacterized protein n=1 Tax=Leptosphaeria maculans TaxID=5022 RepID=UPI0033232BDE
TALGYSTWKSLVSNGSGRLPLKLILRGIARLFKIYSRHRMPDARIATECRQNQSKDPSMVPCPNMITVQLHIKSALERTSSNPSAFARGPIARVFSHLKVITGFNKTESFGYTEIQSMRTSRMADKSSRSMQQKLSIKM